MVAGDGFTGVSEFFKHIAKVAGSFRVVGGEGLLVTDDSLIKFP